MTAALFRRIQAHAVTSEAEIGFFISGRRLQQLVFVVGCVRIMALQAIANRRAVDGSLELCCVFVCVAGEAEARREKSRPVLRRLPPC